jgi:phosphonate transport system substrate-binding protein
MTSVPFRGARSACLRPPFRRLRPCRHRCLPLAAQAEEVLRVSAIPDAPTELQRKFAPLGLPGSRNRDEGQLRAGHRLRGGGRGAGHPQDRHGLAGGFTFVQAKIRTKGTAVPLVQRAEDAKFTSKFITASEGIKGFADLKGKTFAFGAPSSTSGHLMPRYFLGQEGINPDKDFKNTAFSGAHDATVAFVQAGKVDAGVLNASVWDKLVEQKKVDTAKVRVFATTPPYFDYNWTVRGDLDPKIQAKLRDAFLKLDAANPAHKEIMALQRASKFIPTKAENYKGIESAAHAGLLK